MATAKLKAKAPPAQASPAPASPMPTPVAERSSETGLGTALQLVEGPEMPSGATQRAAAARTLQRQGGNARLGRMAGESAEAPPASPNRPEARPAPEPVKLRLVPSPDRKEQSAAQRSDRAKVEPRTGEPASTAKPVVEPAAIQEKKDARENKTDREESASSSVETAPAAAAPAAESAAEAMTAPAGAAPAPVLAKVSAETEAPALPVATAETGSAPPAESAPAAARAPASPENDPAFQAVKARAAGAAKQQKSHGPAGGAADAAQAAAVGPAGEVAAQAAGAQVGKMDAQQPQPFDRAAFKAALLEKIAAITPKTLEEADDFKESGKAGEVKSAVTTKVAEGKEQAQGPIQQAAQETPDPSGFKPKPVTPLVPNDPGPSPPDLGAAGAAPKPKSAAEVEAPMAEAGQSLDRKMADADVTEEQLGRSNEPEFQTALGAKREAQTHAAEAPAAYRASEQTTLTTAQAQAESTAAAQTQTMHGDRAALLSEVTGQQQTTRTADEQKRAQVAQHIERIYQDTKQKVEALLIQLDQEVNGLFDRGAEAARMAFEGYVERRMDAYKDERYSDSDWLLLWTKDKLFGMPAEVNAFYLEGRDLYVREMDGVIDGIAAAVETGLTEAKNLIAAGRQQVQDYVTGLPTDLQKVGQDAATTIQSKFNTLEKSVEEKQGQLIESLAKKYVDNLQKVDTRIDELKAANRGLVDAAFDALGGVLQTILELKDMLLGVLARAADVVGQILKDPIGFLGNLVDGVKLGLSSFLGNLGAHLKEGLLAWLFGALAEAGIQVPESFDLKGILSLILQILGLTYANIRARAVAIVGEPIVQRLEQVADVFKVLVTEGPAGLWRFIKDKLSELKETVMEGIKSFIEEKVITAGITWLLSLFNPAAAFIKACKAIYDIVMFFITRGSQVMALVNAILDSLGAIASGAIAGAAAAVENALAKAIPVVIGFLASLLGLGGLSDKIRTIVQKIQAPVNEAIDWVIHQAVKLVKAAGGMFGKKKEETPPAETGDPEHDAKVMAGLAAIDQAEQPFIERGKISREEAEQAAAQVKREHPVFKTITVVPGAKTWDYDYVASPGNKKTGKEREEEGVDNPYKAYRNSRGNIEGNFANFDWGDYSFAATPHPANVRYRNKNGSSIPQPQGPYELTGDWTEGNIHTDDWRKIEIQPKYKRWKVTLQDIAAEYVNDAAKAKQMVLRNLGMEDDPQWQKKTLAEAIDDGARHHVKKEIEQIYGNFGLSYDEIALVDWSEHHIHPVSFRGSQTSVDNLQYLRNPQHHKVTGWWIKKNNILVKLIPLKK